GPPGTNPKMVGSWPLAPTVVCGPSVLCPRGASGWTRPWCFGTVACWLPEAAMLGKLLKPDYEELIHAKDWASLREVFSELEPPDQAEVLESFSVQDRAIVFRLLPR